VARVQVRRHEYARRPASQARPADRAHRIETDYLPVGDFAALRELLPYASFVPAQRLLARSREIKTPAEIEILRRLSRIADKSITDAYRSVRAGSSEMDIAAALTRGIYEQGVEYSS